MISELDKAHINCVHDWILRTPHPLMSHVWDYIRYATLLQWLFLVDHLCLSGMWFSVAWRHAYQKGMSFGWGWATYFHFELIISKVTMYAIDTSIQVHFFKWLNTFKLKYETRVPLDANTYMTFWPSISCMRGIWAL